MAQSPEYPDLRWMPPRSWTPGRWDGQPTKIVVHYTAGAERSTSAEDGAAYDQRRTDGTSAHYYVDSDSIVQCVKTTDRSHTALYRGNNMGIHYELCGTRQTRAQWLDSASRATIRNAARQMARDMAKYRIPLVRLVNRDVRDAGRKGICGHVDFTYGWPEDNGSHTDPGTEFPYDVLFADIRSFMEGDDDMSWSEKIPAQNWARDAGLYATAGYNDGADVTGAWHQANTNGNVRKLVLRQVPEILAGQAAILAAVRGDDAEEIRAVVADELGKAAEIERGERQAENAAVIQALRDEVPALAESLAGLTGEEIGAALGEWLAARLGQPAA